MTRSRKFPLIVLTAVLAAGLAWPAPALAQRRAPVRRHATGSVVIVGGWGYTYSPFYYDPWYQYPFGPYGYPPYGYPPYGVYGPVNTSASLRLQIRPRQAAVYVDGYRAGIVDDFDGFFQRLYLRPGAHALTIYLDGYRTIREDLYLGPGRSQSIKEDMAPLAAGETAEPPPAPAERPAIENPPPGQPMPPALPPERAAPPVRPAPPRVARAERFGTLSLRVQPADAEVLVDGEKWTAPEGQSRISIELGAGRHHLEVRKDGFRTYSSDVLIRANGTLSLNVSLTGG